MLSYTFNLTKATLASRVPLLESTHGFSAEVYNPVSYESLYEKEDEVTYSDTPDYTGKILVFGLYNYQPASNYDFGSSWFESEIYWIQQDGGFVPEVNALVRITLLDGRVVEFKVVRIEDLVVGFKVADRKPKVGIKVKHPGLLEVPKGKKFYEMPVSHHIELAKRKGYGKIKSLSCSIKKS